MKVMPIMYDIHIATQGGENEKLKEALFRQGYKDDELASQRATFDPRTGQHYVSCPLIGIHMSKKVPILGMHQRSDVADAWRDLRELMYSEGKGEVGYSHLEKVEGDAKIEPEIKEFDQAVQFPCEYSEQKPREKNKVWDIHFSMPRALLPEELYKAMLGAGFYFMSRFKTRGGKREEHANFNLQGINPCEEGRKLFKETLGWYAIAGGPPAEVKLEFTQTMERYGNPEIVPPTVEEIRFR